MRLLENPIISRSFETTLYTKYTCFIKETCTRKQIKLKYTRETPVVFTLPYPQKLGIHRNIFQLHW